MPRRSEPITSQGRAATSSPPGDSLALLVLAGLALLVLADVFRLGFFADDYHFLDAARRQPLGELLLGRHGVWPWYRPLSRELYFLVLVAVRGSEAIVAHALSLAALIGTAWGIYRLALRVAGSRTAAIAPVLYVIYDMSKLLTGWASGFQDLSANLLVVLAVLSQANGRTRLALVLAALAPFAKETGLAAPVLCVAWSVLIEGERRVRPWMVAQGLVLAGAVAIHALVRTTWIGGGRAGSIQASPLELLRGLFEAAAAFVAVPRGFAWGASVGALAAALLVVALVARARRAGQSPAGHGAGAFLGVAIGSGLVPMVAGHLLAWTHPHAYYAFPAIPWVVIAIARAARPLAPALASLALATLTGVNAIGLAHRTPDLDTDTGWHFRRWDWAEAVRLSEASWRLERDLRRLLAARPESLVVLYGALPTGTLFQTEDGPATRESLRDPTVRAYYANGVPLRVVPGRFTIARFDDATHHLALEPLEVRSSLDRGATALASGRARAAYAWASYVTPAEYHRFEVAYLRAGAALNAEGIDGFERELAASELADSTSDRAERLAAALGGADAGVRAALLGVLRRPHGADAHAAYAETLLSRGAGVSAAAALRAAIGLDGTRRREHQLLDRLLRELGLGEQ